MNHPFPAFGTFSLRAARGKKNPGQPKTFPMSPSPTLKNLRQVDPYPMKPKSLSVRWILTGRCVVWTWPFLAWSFSDTLSTVYRHLESSRHLGPL